MTEAYPPTPENLPRPIRVLLVDDQIVIRQAVGSWLGTEPDMRIVGEAEDGEAALAMASELHPDIVLMDVDMPKLDGIATTQALHQSAPECAVVILSLYDDSHLKSRAAAAGAAAFVSKHQALDELVRIIRQVAPTSGAARAATLVQ